MTKELMLTRGIPGSGKSTLAALWVDEDPEWRARVNRDDLRFAMYGKYVLKRMQEDTVTVAQQAQVRALLTAGISVTVDDTNLRAQTVKEWLKIAAECGATVTHMDVETPLDVCVERNNARAAAGGRNVPEDVIRSFYTRYTRKGKFPAFPTLDEKIDAWEPYVAPEVFVPAAYIVDIDGTLAQMTGRGPFDWARVGEDEPIANVVETVKTLALSGRKIIFMSGRDEVSRKATEEWLREHMEIVVDSSNLFMRSEGDMRKDNIVKYELFDANVRGKYRVIGVIDDRLQVVKMWREIGLTVFQCDWGDF